MFDTPLGDVLRRLPLEAGVVALVVGFVLLLGLRRVTLLDFRGRPARLLLPLAGLTAAAASAAGTLVLGLPRPVFTDEWSHLLAADTFSRGRLTNPPLPVPRHFEAFNNLCWPTYQSKYQPGHAAVLAIGVRLGNPALGLWLEAGLLAMAMAWMLRGWLPQRWAVLGTLLCSVGVATSYWTHSFWGGPVAATGGALVLGAFPRLARRPAPGPAVAFGSGLLLLAMSRPFEGLLFTIPVATALAWRHLRSASPATAFRQAGLPLLLGGVLTLGAVGAYDAAVTGSPFVLPQLMYERVYDRSSPFLVLSSYPMEHGSPEMREMRRVGLVTRARERADRRVYARTARSKLMRGWSFFLGVPLTLGLLLAPRALTRSRMRLPLVASAAVGAGLLVVASYHAHYAAPAAGAVLLLGVSGLREATVGLGRRLPRFRSLAVAVLVAGVAVSGLRLWSLRQKGRHAFTRWRESVVATLERTPGADLVLVRYGEAHPPYLEWIYNSAALDLQRIVWARDLGHEPEGNGALLGLFAGRRVWLLEVGDLEHPPRLVAYPEAEDRQPKRPPA